MSVDPAAGRGQSWASRAQNAGERHLEALEWAQSDDAVDEGTDERLAIETESSAPYCGCLTCVVREVLHVTVPIVVQAVRSGEL